MRQKVLLQEVYQTLITDDLQRRLLVGRKRQADYKLCAYQWVSQGRLIKAAEFEINTKQLRKGSVILGRETWRVLITVL